MPRRSAISVHRLPSSLAVSKKVVHDDSGVLVLCVLRNRSGVAHDRITVNVVAHAPDGPTHAFSLTEAIIHDVGGR